MTLQPMQGVIEFVAFNCKMFAAGAGERVVPRPFLEGDGIFTYSFVNYPG